MQEEIFLSGGIEQQGNGEKYGNIVHSPNWEYWLSRMTVNVESFNIACLRKNAMCHWIICSTEEQITSCSRMGFRENNWHRTFQFHMMKEQKQKTVTEQERKTVTLTVRTEQKEVRLNWELTLWHAKDQEQSQQIIFVILCTPWHPEDWWWQHWQLMVTKVKWQVLLKSSFFAPGTLGLCHYVYPMLALCWICCNYHSVYVPCLLLPS